MQENINKMIYYINIIFTVSLFYTNIFFAQDKYKIVTDEETQKPMLVGVSNIEPLKNDTSFSKWFNEEYEKYKINKNDIGNLPDSISGVNFTVVLGTWCSDSRREVPRLIKILDTFNYPVNKIKMVYINRDKKDFEGAADSLSIKLVPTIIVYRNDKELGRIVEAPEETLEMDLRRIVSK